MKTYIVEVTFVQCNSIGVREVNIEARLIVHCRNTNRINDYVTDCINNKYKGSKVVDIKIFPVEAELKETMSYEIVG